MSRYKIMLADDEGIVIDSLKFIIEKEFGDQCAIEFAKTGRSVIELAENFRPDIAIMDIQMPGINGIEAMREIRETNANVVFIVMSAYDKFDYAKEAIKLGVLEYITKPMEKTRIIAALRKAMEQIDRERNKRSNDLLIREKLETVMPIIESGLLYNLLFQEHFTEDIENYKQLLGIDQNYAYILAVVCGDTQEGNHMTNAVGSSVKMQQYGDLLREYLKEAGAGALRGDADVLRGENLPYREIQRACPGTEKADADQFPYRHQRHCAAGGGKGGLQGSDKRPDYDKRQRGACG